MEASQALDDGFRNLSAPKSGRMDPYARLVSGSEIGDSWRGYVDSARKQNGEEFSEGSRENLHSGGLAFLSYLLKKEHAGIEAEVGSALRKSLAGLSKTTVDAFVAERGGSPTEKRRIRSFLRCHLRKWAVTEFSAPEEAFPAFKTKHPAEKLISSHPLYIGLIDRLEKLQLDGKLERESARVMRGVARRFMRFVYDAVKLKDSEAAIDHERLGKEITEKFSTHQKAFCQYGEGAPHKTKKRASDASSMLTCHLKVVITGVDLKEKARAVEENQLLADVVKRLEVQVQQGRYTKGSAATLLRSVKRFMRFVNNTHESEDGETNIDPKVLETEIRKNFWEYLKAYCQYGEEAPHKSKKAVLEAHSILTHHLAPVIEGLESEGEQRAARGKNHAASSGQKGGVLEDSVKSRESPPPVTAMNQPRLPAIPGSAEDYRTKVEAALEVIGSITSLDRSRIEMMSISSIRILDFNRMKIKIPTQHPRDRERFIEVTDRELIRVISEYRDAVALVHRGRPSRLFFRDFEGEPLTPPVSYRRSR